MQLVINSRGTGLRRRGERFVIRRGDRRFELAASKVSSIVVSTGVFFTSDVIQLANEHNVDIVFLDKTGMPTSRVWQSRMGSTATIRRRQLEIAECPEGLSIARDWVIAKLNNQTRFLEQLKQRRPKCQLDFESAIGSIGDLQIKLANCEGTTIERRGSVMGFEGTAGRVYFDCLTRLMPNEYRFKGRSRQPAADPFNAMLNYAYGVLYSQVERALILAGLDPFIGFLHTDNYNKPSLVFDMIEPFRIIAERTTVLLFTGRRVKRDYFRAVQGGIELAPDGRATLITSLNNRLDRGVKYAVQRPKKPGGKKYRRIKLVATIQHEAHSIANHLLGRDDIPKITESDDLFAAESDSLNDHSDGDSADESDSC